MSQILQLSTFRERVKAAHQRDYLSRIGWFHDCPVLGTREMVPHGKCYKECHATDGDTPKGAA